MKRHGVLLLFFASVLMVHPAFAQMDEVKQDDVKQNVVENAAPAADMGSDAALNDEGYGAADQEYNDAEVNAEIPDEYFNDEALTNEEAESPVINAEVTQ